MALDFNPFENDQGAALPVTGKKFKKFKVFEEPENLRAPSPAKPNQLDKKSKPPSPQKPPATSAQAKRSDKLETKLGRTKDKVETQLNQQQIGNKPNTNQTQTKHATSHSSKHKLNTKSTQTEHKPNTAHPHSNTNRTQTEHATLHSSEHKPNTNSIQTEHKPNTNFEIASLVGIQRNLLTYLYFESKKARDKTTPPLTIEHLSKVQTIRFGSVKTSLIRLEQKGYIKRASFKPGRGGWSRYEIHESVFRDMIELETEHKLDTNRTQNIHKPNTQPYTQPNTSPRSSSSLNINKTTTTYDEGLFKNFHLACERFGLFEKGIDSNDLMQVWRKEVFKDQEAFLDCVDRMGFYLSSKESEGIKNPKAWFVKTLSQGHYGAPANFMSWEERQLQAEIQSLEEKRQRLEEKKQKKFELEFELWLEETSEEEKKKILSKHSFLFGSEMNTNSNLSQQFLREAFAKDRGHILSEKGESSQKTSSEAPLRLTRMAEKDDKAKKAIQGE